MLGICLGLQLALEHTDEDGGTDGARAAARAARVRLDGGARAPARAGPTSRRSAPPFYFAHSYACETPAATAWSEGIVAEARAGSFLGVQFHPEKSGAAGARYLEARARGRPVPFPRLIPCLDVAGGRVVKGVRFQELRDVGDPVELGAAYSGRGCGRARVPRRAGDARGARHARRARSPRRGAGRRSRSPSAAASARSADAEKLLAAGADKVAVNSAALARPELLTELAARLGSQAVVVAIDVERGRVRSHAGTHETPRDAVDWAREAVERGAGEILLTSIDADGTRQGYDLALTCCRRGGGRRAR